MTDIYLGKMLWDEGCDISYWDSTGTGGGAGSIGTPIISLDDVTVKHDGVSLKVVSGAGAKEYGVIYHTFSPSDDWGNKTHVLFWFYGNGGGGTIKFLVRRTSLYYRYTITDNVSGWRFFSLGLKTDLGMPTLDDIEWMGFEFFNTGTWYIDFVNVGCALDFVVGYSRVRTSKIPIKKIPAGVSKRDSDVRVRDRKYTIKARLTEVCRDCLESLDDDQAWLGLDDQRIQETVWLDTLPLEHAMGYDHEPEVSNIILVVSAV